MRDLFCAWDNQHQLAELYLLLWPSVLWAGDTQHENAGRVRSVWLGHQDVSGLGYYWGLGWWRAGAALGFGKLIRVHEWSLCTGREDRFA